MIRVRFLLAMTAALILSSAPRPLRAQTAKVVAACGAQSYTAGQFNYPTINVLGDSCSDSGGAGGSVTIGGPLGRQADAASVSTALSTEDYAAITAAIPAGTNPIGSLNPSSYAVTAAVATSKVLKGSAGRLFSLDITADSTLSAAAWYVMVHDATSAPAAGAVTPAKCYGLPAGTTTWTASWPAGGLTMATGIAVTVSTTGCFTQTDSAHAFISGDYL